MSPLRASPLRIVICNVLPSKLQCNGCVGGAALSVEDATRRPMLLGLVRASIAAH